MPPTTEIRVNSDVALDLKKYCLENFGRTHGRVKTETENAIREHIQREVSHG